MNVSKSHHQVKKHGTHNYHRFANNYLRSQKRRALTGRSHCSENSLNQRSTRHHKFSHWLPGDDYLLINSVAMTCNLTEVFHTVRFSMPYTEKDIEARWKLLLFDPIVSSTSLLAISKLPAFVKSRLDRNVPFSAKEDDLITNVSFDQVFPDGFFKHLDTASLINSVFTELLRKDPAVFYAGRDELDLYRQWSRLRDCNLITSTNPSGPSLTLDQESLQSSYHSMKNTSSGGGDPESFSDTELLLQETVSSALSAGVEKLMEAPSVARRRRNLVNPTYHGFQALITDSVLSALNRPSIQTMADLYDPHPDSPKTSRFSNPSDGLRHRQRFSIESRLGNGIRDKRASSVTASDDTDLQRRLELSRRRRRLHARLRATANEATRWTLLVRQLIPETTELATIDTALPSWPPVLATLTGVSHRFLITECRMSFGRGTSAVHPQIDLSLAGDASRVSRYHGSIRVDPDGCFWICNFSSHPVYVDGNPVLADEEVELKDLATVIISRLSFRFDVQPAGVRHLQEHGSRQAKPSSSSLSSSSSSPQLQPSSSGPSVKVADDFQIPGKPTH